MNRPFEIGKIVNTQGLKGEVRVVPSTDDISRYELLDYVLVEDGKTKELVKYEIEKVRYHKNFVLLKFKNLDSINQVMCLKNSTVKIPEDLALPLEEDEYYVRDLYDMEVYEEDGSFLGVISDIIETGANDVYVVKKDGENDLLLPAIKQCILEVNPEENKMVVHVMEGLR